MVLMEGFQETSATRYTIMTIREEARTYLEPAIFTKRWTLSVDFKVVYACAKIGQHFESASDGKNRKPFFFCDFLIEILINSYTGNW